jgi:glutaredoxin
MKQEKKSNEKKIWIIVGVIIALLFIASFVVARSPGKYDAFAQCLDQKGVKFYGAFWCPHCQKQKALFGRSSKKLPYVECSTPQNETTQACKDAGIKNFPTWVFADGSRQTGEMTLEELAAKSSCSL